MRQLVTRSWSEKHSHVVTSEPKSEGRTLVAGTASCAVCSFFMSTCTPVGGSRAFKKGLVYMKHAHLLRREVGRQLKQGRWLILHVSEEHGSSGTRTGMASFLRMKSVIFTYSLIFAHFCESWKWPQALCKKECNFLIWPHHLPPLSSLSRFLYSRG